MSSDYFVETLPNNLKVVFVPSPKSSYVFFSLLGRVGRRAEKDSEVGAAHFLEHLFFDGTFKRPSAFEINKYIEESGGLKNGLTSQETVQYFVKILADNYQVGAEYLSDIFFNSRLTDDDIEKEKKVIKQESIMRKDNPDDALYRHRFQLLYPKQNIGRTIFDEEDNLPNISSSVLRGYKDRVYNSDNFILTIAGNITKSKAMTISSKYFSQFQPGTTTSFEPVQIETQQVTMTKNMDIKQGKLSISYKGFSAFTTDSIYARLVMATLGWGFSSRLYDKLRNRLHLVYQISSAHRGFSDTGFAFIEAFCNPENISVVIEEIFKELKKFVENGCTERELQRAKNIYTSRFLFDLEHPIDRAEFYTDQLLLKGDILGVDHYKDVITSATPADLQRVAQLMFSDLPKINTISPKQ